MNSVDSSMTVIASTLMECCSTGLGQVGDQDPINKQLFNKTIMQFRAKVISFYEKVKNEKPVSQKEVVDYIKVTNTVITGHYCMFRPRFTPKTKGQMYILSKHSNSY